MPSSENQESAVATALDAQFIPDHWFNMDIVSPEETLIRVGCAIVFGFILGFERGRKNKPMDFRAYMIVAAASCIIAIMGQELSTDYAGDNAVVTLDLGKIIAGVLTGIGFLGAGAIIKVEKTQIVGTATGASIWAAGGIGLCLGFGMYGLALVGFLAVVCILVLGGILAPNHAATQEDRTGNAGDQPE